MEARVKVIKCIDGNYNFDTKSGDTNYKVGRNYLCFSVWRKYSFDGVNVFKGVIHGRNPNREVYSEGEMVMVKIKGDMGHNAFRVEVLSGPMKGEIGYTSVQELVKYKGGG